MIGGSGGGRPDFAQAGGPDAAKLDDALNQVVQLIRAAVIGATGAETG